MKTIQETLTEFDRMSTHEELHQVLALLDECAPVAGMEAPAEAEERKALREAVADLWQDGAANETGNDQQTGLQGGMYPWAEILADKSHRVN
jgi:hypothetical protein